MSKKRCLSKELVYTRQSKAYENLTQEIEALWIPFKRAVFLVDGVLNFENVVFVRVKLSWMSLIGFGLFEIYTKLRIYYHLDDSDPIASRCHVRIMR